MERVHQTVSFLIELVQNLIERMDQVEAEKDLLFQLYQKLIEERSDIPRDQLTNNYREEEVPTSSVRFPVAWNIGKEPEPPLLHKSWSCPSGFPSTSVAQTEINAAAMQLPWDSSLAAGHEAHASCLFDTGKNNGLLQKEAVTSTSDIIDVLAIGKPLPADGMFLQAVRKAGEELHMLLEIGEPLPRVGVSKKMTRKHM